jgi:hypothetical protein
MGTKIIPVGDFLHKKGTDKLSVPRLTYRGAFLTYLYISTSYTDTMAFKMF